MLSCFPLDVLDEIWDLTESVSEGFLTYFCKGSFYETLVTLVQRLVRTFIVGIEYILKTVLIQVESVISWIVWRRQFTFVTNKTQMTGCM